MHAMHKKGITEQLWLDAFCEARNDSYGCSGNWIQVCWHLTYWATGFCFL